MNALHPSLIDSWRVHVYFGVTTRDVAWALREAIQVELADCMVMGTPTRTTNCAITATRRSGSATRMP